jgi:phospholipid/cholesterol/gamma-HCH transport system ATP-binding protein
MASDPPVLRFEHVNLHFGDTPAMVDLSFEIAAGETRVILGAAGSGKTTLLKTAVGLVKPDSGRVYLFGEDVTDYKESQMYGIRSRVGILFQEGGLFDSLTIAENVAYPLLNQQIHAGHSAAGQPALREDNPEVEKRVRDSLRFVELEHTLDKFPSELSGGMRRRVGIARAVVTEPALVLYDSPTAGLDPITANTIINLIIKERDLRNAAAIMITHRFLDGHLMANFRYNPNSGEIEPASAAGVEGDAETTQVSTKFLVMQDGRLVFEGTEAELLASTDPYVMKFQKAGSS